MPFIPLQAPPHLDLDGLRKHGEDQDREIARAWTEVESRIAAIEGGALTNWNVAQAAMSSCRLYGISSTQLRLDPFNGNGVKVNGVWYGVPAAGITVSNGGLSANTTYYVYVTTSGTLELSTTGPANDTTVGNIGTLIKAGDPTRSLVGLARVNASSQFVDSAAQRFVASLFNRRPRPLRKFMTTYSTTSSTFTEHGAGAERVEWVGWNDVATSLSYTISIDLADNGASGGISYTMFGVDGATVNGAAASYSGTVGNFYVTHTQDLVDEFAIGYHHAEIFWASGAAGYTTSSITSPQIVGTVWQ